MKNRHAAAMVMVLAAGAGMAGCETGGRTGGGWQAISAGDTRRVLFDQGWLFSKGDDARAEQAGFDDSAWRKVALPHDWSVEGPYDGSLASATAFLPGGIAWYRKHFTLPGGANGARGKTVTLRFEGVYKHSTVYLNGREVGGRAYGYSTFEVDLPSDAIRDGDNVLAVRVDHHDFADSRWYPGSGIYRDVWLEVRDAVHIMDDGVFVTTPEVSGQSATVNVETSIKNGLGVGPVEVVTQIMDDKGRMVARGTQQAAVFPAKTPRPPVVTTQTLTVTAPLLWSVDRPVMYTAVTELRREGTVIDTYRAPFGIRTEKFDPNTGFWLNGENLKLKGVCLHEDAGSLGAAIPREVWERRLRILKEAGVNAIRTSHNPPDAQFLDLCDQLGFLVMDEAFDEWSKGKKKWIDGWNGTKYSTDGYHSDFAANSDRDVQDMVRRDRNHPSIVMWSIGNEIDYPNDPYPLNSQEPVDIAKRLVADVKAVDTTRPVTAACAAIASNLYFPALDIVGYNYQEGRYASDHAANPTRVIYGSENKPDLAAWLSVKDNPYISGQFLWTGIDYMGEAHAYPNHASTDGFVDLAGFPKAAYWFRKSLWNDMPMVEIEPAAGRGGQGRLNCYTNCDTVEFFEGKKSLGDLALPAQTHIIPVPANAGGTITAVGKKGGKPLLQIRYTPAGPAAKVKAEEYPTTLGPGAGRHVSQIEVTLTDAAGNRVRDAANEITVTVPAGDRLLAMESGDNNSSEDPHAGHRKAFHGRMLIYVEGDARGVKVEAAGLPISDVATGLVQGTM